MIEGAAWVTGTVRYCMSKKLYGGFRGLIAKAWLLNSFIVVAFLSFSWLPWPSLAFYTCSRLIHLFSSLICSPLPLALLQLDLAGDTSLPGNRSFRRMGSSRRVAACPNDAAPGGDGGGSTRPVRQSPSLWGRTPSRSSGNPTTEQETTADAIALPDRALSVPALAWDGHGAPPRQTSLGGDDPGGRGIGPPVATLNRGASFSGTASFARSASLSRGATSFRRSSVLDAALMPLQSIRVRSSAGWEGEDIAQVRLAWGSLAVSRASYMSGRIFPSDRYLLLFTD